ncbi:MAG: threonyl-tRNA synthetase [Candidatus Sumerlaeota bacterium]|nr:threonyl-tRNA synthetase [Candidatus Sumerlaeota bacterium]
MSITITLPDGSTKEFAGAVTGAEVAAAIGPGLAKAALAIQIDGQTADLATPIERDAHVAILTARQPAGVEVLRHSCTHLMAQAIKRLWPDAMLEDGPPTEDGFWYDIRTDPPVSPEDFGRIEKTMLEIVKEDLPIKRRELTREEALVLFAERGEKYKLDIINKIPDGQVISTYQQGEFIDLCRGPHVPSTGAIRAFKLLSVAGAYWKGDARNDQLTRIRGTAFGDKKEMKEYLELLEEAKKRDHRKLGRDLELFMHHEWAPGETIWLPKGKSIYDTLSQMSSALHKEQGYQEVFTPMLFKKDLFETSGHWKHFRDDMFIVPGQEATTLEAKEVAEWAARLEAEIPTLPAHEQERVTAALKNAGDAAGKLALILLESPTFSTKYWNLFEKKPGEFVFLTGNTREVYALKPMNCPSHMLIFRDRRRSYRELPLRISDQGVLHRNEDSGALSGLTRVRQFCQDDAHIFLSEEMIAEEIARVISMVRRVYEPFGLEFSKVFLSTRPAKAMGTKEQWDLAESALKEAIEANKMDYQINEGDGAFYGPKIDFIVRDALRREFQVATIQLDSQLPARFDLKYTAADGSEKMPIVVHRAIFGSFERFLGIVIEHFAGAFPVWLAPVQVRVLSISEKYVDYARKVYDALLLDGVRAELDVRDDKIGAKIREAQLQKVPYMLVVGEKEQETAGVSVRSREKGDEGAMPLDVFRERMRGEKSLAF